LLVVPSGVYKWSIKRVTNPNPVYSHTYYVTVLILRDERNSRIEWAHLK
jgi:hypothetical protein